MPNKTIELKIYAKNTNAEILSSMLNLLSGILKTSSLEIVDKKLTDPSLVYSIVQS